MNKFIYIVYLKQNKLIDNLAYLVEHSLSKREVMGLSPIVGFVIHNKQKSIVLNSQMYNGSGTDTSEDVCRCEMQPVVLLQPTLKCLSQSFE